MGMSASYTPDRIHRKTVVFLGKPINLSKLAKEMNVSHSLLSRIFSGERNGSANSIRRISEQLGITMEEMLKALESKRH